jgi:competence protein ComEA
MMRTLAIAISVFGLVVFLGNAADDDELPAGKGKDVLLTMCVKCHGPDQIAGAKYSKKLWVGVVDDMVSRGAEGSDADIKILVDYLARNFGKPININTSTAQEIEDGLTFSTADSELLVRYRTEKGLFKTYEDLLKVPGIDAKQLEEQKKNILF